MRDPDDEDTVIGLDDPVEDPVVAAPRPVQARELTAERLADPERVLGEQAPAERHDLRHSEPGDHPRWQAVEVSLCGGDEDDPPRHEASAPRSSSARSSSTVTVRPAA